MSDDFKNAWYEAAAMYRAEKLEKEHYRAEVESLQSRIRELEGALRDVMNASNCPYEVAKAALSSREARSMDADTALAFAKKD